MTSLLLLLIMAALLSPSSATTSANPDLAVALGEMQKANYFAYMMLINMAPPDLIQSNITFLMPNDKSLSTTNIIAESSISDFLLHHSIPWPLLFDHMEHFPTGSIIPTSMPGFVLKVLNGGRHQFFFNNARIISPNICTKASSIRCHGIDAVVQPALLPEESCPPHAPLPLPPPPPAAAKNATQHATQPSPSPPPSSVEVDDDGPPKSGSTHRHCHPYPLMCNGAVAGVVSLVMTLGFML